MIHVQISTWSLTREYWNIQICVYNIIKKARVN